MTTTTQLINLPLFSGGLSVITPILKRVIEWQVTKINLILFGFISQSAQPFVTGRPWHFWDMSGVRCWGSQVHQLQRTVS